MINASCLRTRSIHRYYNKRSILRTYGFDLRNQSKVNTMRRILRHVVLNEWSGVSWRSLAQQGSATA
jgi:hypothetical protein